jgi:mRNA interferase RelE/StbE
MSGCFKLRIPDEIVGLIRGLHPTLKRRVKAALFDISHNPYCGKALKAELSGLRSFRIKKFRIIYRVSHNNEISIVALGPRKYIYEETFRIIRREEEKQLPGSVK